jgi:uncharacterized protein with LGFP repeats
MPDDFQVIGEIRTHWRVRGAEKGPFGRPIGPEEDVPDRNGRRQRFEHGEIGQCLESRHRRHMSRDIGDTCDHRVA